MNPPRDPHAIPLHCMHCRTSGTAHVVEPKVEADMLPPKVQVPWLSPGFRVSRLGRTAGDTEFRCGTCDEVAG